MSRIATIVLTLATAYPLGLASAADLTSKAPAPLAPPAAAANWSGAYVGLSLGYGWAQANQNYTITSATLAAAPPIIPVIEGSGSHAIDLKGAAIDADIGYNWQSQQGLVFGLEGDLAWSGLAGSQYNGGNVPNYPPGYPYSITQKFMPEAQAALRARLGYAPTDQLLLFVAGGPAFALLHYTSAYTDTWAENEDVSISTWKPGWTIGGGGEYALTTHWSVKAEYAFSQFTAATAVGSTTLTDGTTAYGAHSTGTLNEHTVRAGLNYHF